MSQIAGIPDSVKRHTVGHHFANAESEFSAAKLGFWIFLATETLMFGGLFVAYSYFRSLMPETFEAAHRTLSVPLGTLNTVVLITSSLTMALAIRSAMVNKQKQMMAFLVITLVAAAGFMVIKLGFEWPHKFHEGTLPSYWYTYEGLKDVPNPQIFYGLYFVMTGLHGLHVIIGMGLILWLIILGKKGRFYSGYYTPLEITGLYWHFVDLVWIFLFPLFYLVA
ncbi:cytochrome c oxidase subunit 3 family protein [Vulgatibacter incomptus]|uniref:Cytochrome c oxidase polypeptide III n=1 Tax=Vulgatibacter incomptus TaxID=1391653 RepID=A0A0K1PH12_9BACT|nr:cytochrome c oxidase subunit 3 family protein [Vulgatibacter incomptus]AKU92805.1 Cytochrome c oxidase polypeptide III [Vulgatibacter incomptus]